MGRSALARTAAATQRRIHARFSAIYLRLGDDSYERLTGALQAVLDRYAGALQADPAAWLALRRRVAEATLTVAISKQRPVAECERLLGESTRLGWRDLHRRAQMMAMFCGYSTRCGHGACVRRHLLPLLAALEAEAARTGEALWTKHVRACQDILSRAEESQCQRNGEKR